MSAPAQHITADFVLAGPLGLYYYLCVYELPPISWKRLLLNNSSISVQKAIPTFPLVEELNIIVVIVKAFI